MLPTMLKEGMLIDVSDFELLPQQLIYFITFALFTVPVPFECYRPYVAGFVITLTEYAVLSQVVD